MCGHGEMRFVPFFQPPQIIQLKEPPRCIEVIHGDRNAYDPDAESQEFRLELRIGRPYFAINYGFEPILNTPGNVAGLGRFDAFFGVTIFDSIYGRNANVFAAVPSLHAAYMVVALVYAIIGKCRWYVITLFAVIMLGIWGTAVYSCHHYIIDVLLGISCALLGWLVFEYGLMKIPAFNRFFDRYYKYIK